MPAVCLIGTDLEETSEHADPMLDRGDAPDCLRQPRASRGWTNLGIQRHGGRHRRTDRADRADDRRGDSAPDPPAHRGAGTADMMQRALPTLVTAVVVAVAGCDAGTEREASTTPPPGPETALSAESSGPPTPTPTGSPEASASARPLTAAQQAQVDERLRRAAWRNDVRAARRLIARGADVNAKDETQQSTYLIATSEGYLDLLRLTLRNGARLDDKDSWNGTGLIRAAERGHFRVVGELLRAGIDRDHVNRIGYQAVHEAVWLGEDNEAYASTLRVLAAGGVRLSDKSVREALTPLAMARTRGYARLEKTLTTLTTTRPPADPDAALLRAAAAGDADAVAVALRAGADIEARDGRRRTALLRASTRDRVSVANLLVAMGADPSIRDGDGVTALEHARAKGYVEIARLLAGR